MAPTIRLAVLADRDGSSLQPCASTDSETRMASTRTMSPTSTVFLGSEACTATLRRTHATKSAHRRVAPKREPALPVSPPLVRAERVHTSARTTDAIATPTDARDRV